MTVSKDSDFIIYGAGEVGSRIAVRLMEEGYSVQGFLDLRPGSQNMLNGIRVYQVDEEVPWEEERVIVIIALANGNIHKEVADNLYRKGYAYIVFLPIALFLSQSTKNRLIAEYNEVMEGKCGGMAIHEYSEYRFPELKCEDGIVKESDGYIWTFVAQEILFSESYENWKGDKSKLTGIQTSYDRNIVLRKWYRNLFQYFENEAEDCEEYFNIFEIKKGDIEKERLLRERQSLFQLYKMEFQRGLDFFVETAPLAEWNSRGYFNLVGGHHRTIFLLEQGLTCYPVKMTKDDFAKWCNYNKLDSWKKCVEEDGDEFWDIPIPHPAYRNCIYKRENLKVTLMDKILNYFELMDVKNLSVLDASQADGYFARVFARSGVKEAVCYDTKYARRIENLFDLLYVQNANVIKEISSIESRQYDIVFALSPNSFVYEDGDILYKLLQMSAKYFFAEILKEREDILEFLIRKGSCTYCEKFANEVMEGKEYDIYLLIK